MKRRAPEGGKKKATSKRPKTLGPSIGAPVAVTRTGIPRITIILPRNVDPNDEEVEAVLAPSIILAPSTTISTSRVATMVMSSLGSSIGCARKGISYLGTNYGPFIILGTESTWRFLGPSGIGTSLAPRETGISLKPSRHQTSISRSKVDGGWIYQIHIDESDSALHNLVVTRELSRVMLHPQDMKELGSQTMSEMVSETFLTIIKVCLISFFQILAKKSFG